MVKIKDLDEKMYIMAYHKCSSRKNIKNIFNNTSIYNDWWRWWGTDFPKNRNGNPVQIYKDHLVISANKYKQGIIPQAYKEYTKVLDSITLWMKHNYNRQIRREENCKKFKDALIQLRKDHYDNLLKIMNDNELGKEGYLLQDTSSSNIYDLRTYCLIHSGDSISVVNGSYEIILDSLESIIGIK